MPGCDAGFQPYFPVILKLSFVHPGVYDHITQDLRNNYPASDFQDID
jgi:hypothetical protein